MIRIAVFASGNGTNAKNLITFFSKSAKARVVLVLSNNKDAKVLEKAKILNVNTMLFNKKDLYTSSKLLNIVKEQIDFIVLAGFLWKIPNTFIKLFPNKIVNIHPALLPKYGGKGMYGMYVHKAVKDNEETETGITIHFVNENYDEGAVIFQKKIAVIRSDTAVEIANKIHTLEQKYFPIVIDSLLETDFN